jgi:hypothetical protein
MADRPLTRDMRRHVPNNVPRVFFREQGLAARPGALARGMLARGMPCLFARC